MDGTLVEETSRERARLSDKENIQRLDYYRLMLQMMLWEQKLLWFIDEGEVSGFFHAGRGQEAVPAGACSYLRDDDYMLYAHRGCGYMLAKGLSMERLFHDFLGNVEGTTKGLGAGIVHVAWPELGILGQSGTLGGSFNIAAGVGLSAKYRGTDQVVVCFFGDGTANRGTWHEAANVAALWSLPVIFICENNLWATSTAFSASTSVTDIAQRASAYGMPGDIVDGQDVEAVADVVNRAIERARDGQGPSLIEAKTYRYRGHYHGDPATYRDQAELDAWKERDPLEVLRERILSAGEATSEELEQIRLEVSDEVEAAAQRAAAGNKPTRERIYEYLYV